MTQALVEDREYAGSADARVGGDLLELQWLQLRHDQTYHADILALTTQNRVKHMTLHFAKYVGAIAATGDDEGLQIERPLVDAFIISLATANALNVNLRNAMGIDERGLKQVGNQWAMALGRPRRDSHYWLLRLLAEQTGRMAKCCESLDHLEQGDFGRALADALVNIVKVIVAEASVRGLDLPRLRARRLSGIEGKNLFASVRSE
jgi:hypothetical protein